MNPLIALFKTPNGKYFFDANKDEMISISDESFSFLSKLKTDNASDTQVIPFELMELKKQGYLKDESAVKDIRHIYTDYLDIFLKRKISMMTIQLTQDCNLRCKYCVYSEEHNRSQRSHSTKVMSWETAKKAVDFLAEHSIDSPSINIGFYGGEPLLEFSLLKKIIEYCKVIFLGKEFSLNMTTNGILLTDEIILYLEDQNVSLMISIDGPKEINDINRVFIDGSGTFDVVAERIRRIKEIAPDYAKKINLSMVMDPRNDFDCINEIYIKGSDFHKLNTSPTLVEGEFGDEGLPFSESYVWKNEYHFFLAMLAHYGRYPKEQVSPIAINRMSFALTDYARIIKAAPLQKIDSPSGPCIPGQMRLFVNVDGLFFPCERVSEKSAAMCIGSLENGFNLESAKNILNVGTLTKEECLKCWCFRYCDMCAKKADNEAGELSSDLKLSHCNDTKAVVRQRMEQVLLLSEIPKYYAHQMMKGD